jgi:predicted ATP-grasp superfamily ATP-dependent carboligase
VKAALRILVYEYVSGGGFADEAISASVLSEGFGMLRSLTADFKAAGHHVTTMLDARIARLNPPIPADCSVPVFSRQETQKNLCKLSEQVDAAYIIAPETDGVLRSLVETVEQTGAASLNCESGAIEKVSAKVGVYEFMRELGLPVPKTLTFAVEDDMKEIVKGVQGGLGFPVVFKPFDGVSCGGVSAVQDESQVASAIAKIKVESSGKRFLVQELVEGAAASVSLFSTGSRVVPVTLNRQDVVIETPEACSSYSGGSVPFAHPLKAEAFEAAEKLVKAVQGLRGYVGVDFVLTEEAAVAVEVNPRLTTSYVGLRRVVNFNPAQAIIDAVLNRKLPIQVESRGYAYFSKVETPRPTLGALQEMYSMDEVVSPPFPVSDVSSALVASYGGTLQEASLRFREAKKRVLDTISGGG